MNFKSRPQAELNIRWFPILHAISYIINVLFKICFQTIFTESPRNNVTESSLNSLRTFFEAMLNGVPILAQQYSGSIGIRSQIIFFVPRSLISVTDVVLTQSIPDVVNCRQT